MTTDSTGSVAPVTISLIPGTVAPRGDNAVGVDLTAAVITEQGMASRLPLVDLHLVDHEGNRFVATTSGRMLCAIAAAIRGVNVRNHGKAEP
jgi:hypothetical protein